MKFSKILVLSLINFLLTIFLVFLFLKKEKQSENYAVIDKERVFNEFKMTKEIKNQINILNNKLKIKYDSLSYIYSTVQNVHIKIDAEQKLKLLSDEIERVNGAYREQEVLKIWKRIRSYSKDYSNSSKYKLILGFENNGDIVYYEETKDITNELLHYINKRYEGIQ